MIPYFFLIAIPVVFAFIPIDKKSAIQKILLFFTGIIYIFFIGFRHEIGSDWSSYLRMYDYIGSGTLTEGFERTEPGYVILNWLMAKINAGIYGVNLVAAIIFVLGLVKFAEKMPQPWLGLVSVTPYLVIAVGLGLTRQSAAIGLVFYMMAGWDKNSSVKNIIISLLAISFHYTAFIALVFVLQSMKMPVWLRWIFLLSGSAISFVILTKTEQYAVYEQLYVSQKIESFGALQHIALNAIPAIIYLIFIKKWNITYGKNNLISLLSYLSLLSLLGISLSSTSTAMDRLSLYLSPIQMLVYSSIPVVFKNKFFSVIIVVMSLAILYAWLNYSNTAIDFLPYNNILFN